MEHLQAATGRGKASLAGTTALTTATTLTFI